MRVILADDDRNVRSALRLLIEKELQLDVSGEAENGEGLLEEAAARPPDLVLLDWELPGLKSEALLPALRACCPEAKLIGLSGQPEARQKALRAGVDAFVSKGDPPEKVMVAVRKLMLEGE